MYSRGKINRGTSKRYTTSCRFMFVVPVHLCWSYLTLNSPCVYLWTVLLLLFVSQAIICLASLFLCLLMNLSCSLCEKQKHATTQRSPCMTQSGILEQTSDHIKNNALLRTEHRKKTNGAEWDWRLNEAGYVILYLYDCENLLSVILQRCVTTVDSVSQLTCFCFKLCRQDLSSSNHSYFAP